MCYIPLTKSDSVFFFKIHQTLHDLSYRNYQTHYPQAIFGLNTGLYGLGYTYFLFTMVSTLP